MTMDITIHPRKLRGTLQAIPSKSQAHRLLICAAFADSVTELCCPQVNQDIEATVQCLRSLGAGIVRTHAGYRVTPISTPPKAAVLPCRESGSTLRFLLPVAGALGVDAVFTMAGRLPRRPLSPLQEELMRMGCYITRPTVDTLRCQGQLRAGNYTISGSVSSQFISGLLFACALIPGVSRIHITDRLESAPYVTMTQEAMGLFGVDTTAFLIHGGGRFHSPGNLPVEGDWSNAAFFLGAQALGSDLEIQGLNPCSSQGDRAVSALLAALSQRISISARDIPDLVPILAVVAAGKQGAVFTDIMRLRLKESDRAASVAAMLRSLGIRTDVTENQLTVHPGIFQGGAVDACGDHRIAMAAAVAATVCQSPVTILGAECVEKSYPQFWAEYRRLGGNYEQHLR